ncbi:TetR/AcrR family transcriptional regulator [uncultured Pseudoflavonifractor sp.]|uniref:TetR/AcrR family transcriptional regulator n=1 Tax=uncultured Pseudoflavonifractor sp. TaxID=1221379 RepID=UPI0025E3F873|nr:TetR-like C-terminal domain-containing protein [uncultured Pseudoflavonifractor sp.]
MEKEERKENQRTRLTKRLLRESLLGLLEEKPVERITVKELCERAELNRSTFYAYYQDVVQLYYEMGNELVDALLDYVRDMGADRVQTEPMLAYIKERREMFALLIYNGQFMDMNAPLQRRVFEETIRYIWPAGAEMSVAGPEWKYILQYMFMGGSGLIHRWVRDGCDMEPAELAALLGGLTETLLRAALGLARQKGKKA